MKTLTTRLTCILAIILTFMLTTCSKQGTPEEEEESDMKVIFLHHSTGEVVWNGNTSIGESNSLPSLLLKYNEDNETAFSIKELNYPKASPYGWNNYPYDYYNIWIKNGGDQPYMEESTLEILTKEYQVIVFKHCYPVCDILPDDDNPDIDSPKQTLANYKLQYQALKSKMHEFPGIKFILFTGAAHVQGATTEADALRAKEFFNWVINTWDESGDNIYLWDFYSLETEGGLYLKDEYSAGDSHPNASFAGQVAPLLFNRIIDVITNNGQKTSLTGQPK